MVLSSKPNSFVLHPIVDAILFLMCVFLLCYVPYLRGSSDEPNIATALVVGVSFIGIGAVTIKRLKIGYVFMIAGIVSVITFYYLLYQSALSYF